MTGITRLLNSKSWRYATLEVCLIFIGITLALLANAWYENRSERNEEVQILAEVMASLRSDIDVFENRLVEIDEKLSAMKSLEDHILNGGLYSTDLNASFSHILNVQSANMNTTAFETLTFRGIELVSSAALRAQLVDYYDSERANLDQRTTFDSADVYSAEPFYKANFRWINDSSRMLLMEPIDYDAIIENQEFRNILTVRIWGQEQMTTDVYTRIKGKAESLVLAIGDHLATLAP